ncbi:MAG: phosphodiesterase [Firmicutes bacterium]|nr:phosphodiesterase [Bacillota bacterium]
MKIMIASDIHGSAEFCEAFLEAYKNEVPDKILLLGDILYHGPRNNLPNDYDTKRTMEILNDLKDEISAVRGNCDSEVDQMVLNFPLMNTYEIVEADGIKLFATHGHHYSPDNPPPFVEFDVLLNGHTHISMLADCGDYYYANPGSVSIPKGGTTHSYMICEDRMLTIKNLLTMDEIDKMYIKKK